VAAARSTAVFMIADVDGDGWGMEEEWMDGRWDGGWRGRDGGVSGVWGTELKLELSMGLGKARRANDECDQCCLADSATSVTRSLFEDCTCARPHPPCPRQPEPRSA
jgi:hypothetical protein